MYGDSDSGCEQFGSHAIDHCCPTQHVVALSSRESGLSATGRAAAGGSLSVQVLAAVGLKLKLEVPADGDEPDFLTYDDYGHRKLCRQRDNEVPRRSEAGSLDAKGWAAVHQRTSTRSFCGYTVVGECQTVAANAIRGIRQPHETWPLDCVLGECRQLLSARSWRGPEDAQGAKLVWLGGSMISNPHEHQLGVALVSCRSQTAAP